jgi:alkylhydroperoxidase family enzyme
MAQLLEEIEWGEALYHPVVVPEWEAEAKARFAGTYDYLRRVAPLPWLRRICAMWQLYPISRLPLRLADFTMLVVSQENACRYCYGVARAHLRIVGYSERVIGQIERELQLAELDQKDQAFLRFCRQLARSNPRPAKAERDEMLRLGFSQEEIAETAFLVADNAFHNRVATLMAAPPVAIYERLGRSWLGRLLRPMLAFSNRRSMAVPRDFAVPEGAPFERITRPLAGLPAAYMLHQALTAAFDSPILSRRIKVLMFAVVARILECRFCPPETVRLLQAEGFDAEEVEACLASLSSPRLDANESAILEWTRETVRYQPLPLQRRTRALYERIGPQATLEAIGVASLANSTVRLAMLAE